MSDYAWGNRCCLSLDFVLETLQNSRSNSPIYESQFKAGSLRRSARAIFWEASVFIFGTFLLVISLFSEVLLLTIHNTPSCRGSLLPELPKAHPLLLSPAAEPQPFAVLMAPRSGCFRIS